MKATDVAILGAGQAGLAMSRCLAERGIEHVVLERGRIAERWRSERWDSLRLLTPNWLSRLPGYTYRGPDPHGFMRAGELANHLDRYAQTFAAPVQPETTVLSVEGAGKGETGRPHYTVRTDRFELRARAVVIATGAGARANIPPAAKHLPRTLLQLPSSAYKNPSQLPEGGVLVVGASASGTQLADEIQRSGRAVTLAAGSHLRLPRRYRGHDILWWLDAMGILARRAEHVSDIARARRQPSYQLVGRADHTSLDLPALRARGVRLCGRVKAIDGDRVLLHDDLAASAAAADEKLREILSRIDAFASARAPRSLGQGAGEASADVPAAFVPGPAPTRLQLRDEGIRSVVWATGFRESYPFLQVPVCGPDGSLRHRGGVTDAPGLYALGLRFLRRRDSSFIDGVGADAQYLSQHLCRYLDRRGNAAA